MEQSATSQQKNEAEQWNNELLDSNLVGDELMIIRGRLQWPQIACLLVQAKCEWP